MSEKIIAYKAMNPDMTCRGKKYETGKTYFEDKADCCNAGMHACENPFEVLSYYPMRDNPRFFEVECGGEISKSDEGSKLACTTRRMQNKEWLARLKDGRVKKIGMEGNFDTEIIIASQPDIIFVSPKNSMLLLPV